MKGNFENPSSIKVAAEDVDVIFFITTPFEKGIEFEIQQGKIITDIAKEVRVKHLVFNSVGSANLSTGIPHFDSKYEIEKYILSKDLPYTIVRPTYFMDNIISSFNL